MDISIRRNERCIIGLPRCDFVFSSTRTCFVAYGFKTSPLEVAVIRRLLQEKGVQCEEAGGNLAPGQNAFCQKICSKIITSQFCIVLLNHDEKGGQLVPNANVNMEYGLILGFNKYVIPFQIDSQSLPFNVAALDTVKYQSTDFESKASSAIDIAIEKTAQDQAGAIPTDQLIELFLVSKKALFSPIDSPGDKAIFRMGNTFGFNLLNDFSGMIYIFFGNFTALRPEIVIWRLTMVNSLVNERMSSLPQRIELKLMTPEQKKLTETFFTKMKIWILVNSDGDKAIIASQLGGFKLLQGIELFSLSDVRRDLDAIGTTGAGS